MLSNKQASEILDALDVLIRAINKHGKKLLPWETGLLRITEKLAAALIRESRVPPDTLTHLRDMVDQLEDLQLGPISRTPAVTRFNDAATDRKLLQRKLATLEGLVDTGDEDELRKLFQEAMRLTGPDDAESHARLAQIRKTMGWG